MSRYANYPSLAGRRVLITGGAAGIGAALVEAFADQGARVGFLDLDEVAGSALQQRLPGTRFVPADVRDIASLREALDTLVGQLEGADVLINNAANDARQAFDAITPEFWDEALAVNLRHHFFAAQRIAPHLRAVGGGSIINLGSVSWMRGRPGFAGYSTSKAAINGLTRTLARELGADGIRVNALVPGAIRTERQARLWRTPAEDAKFLELQSLKFHLQPEQVARMALFLAADDSEGCTGQNFIVDAGLV